ncbi:Tn7-like element transposition protein TnsE [Reinekea sp. G2M2-21]|uniref:Tn7-like element transposition protein TnsE n=1 Tax=Reinekea sp. G2M2-21 TaxID=2788942 RepID=UPI0018AB47E8|nr:Tn7-like element transposition protein TnsE [Reinekea sp. G2M2-21]
MTKKEHRKKAGSSAQIMDSVVDYVGCFKRRSDGNVKWSIEVGFEDGMTTHVGISVAPLLVKGKVLNPSGSDKTEESQLDIVRWIDIYDDIERAQPPSELNSRCSYYELNSIGTLYFVPAFELARALFLKDSYFARLSVRHNSLNEEFYIEETKSKIKISILSGADYPQAHFNSDSSLEVLSWMLLNEKARRSFDSIAMKLIINSEYTSSCEEESVFDFQPPGLFGAKMLVRASKMSTSSQYLVNEIISIVGVSHSADRPIEFHYPLERVSSIPSDRLKPSTAVSNDLVDVDFGAMEDASVDREYAKIDYKPTNIVFKEAPLISREFVVTVVDRLTDVKEVSDVDSVGTTVGDSAFGGEGQGVGIGPNAQDNSGHPAFLDIEKMINVLVSRYRFQSISKNIYALPMIAGSKNHLLTDGLNPRSLLVCQLKVATKYVVVLEVDISDKADHVSTLVLYSHNDEVLFTSLNSVVKGLMTNSLHWPSQLLDKYRGEVQYFRLNHPVKGRSQEFSSAEIESWAARFISNLPLLI